MRSFWTYFLGVAIRPTFIFSELLLDARRLRLALLAITLTAGMYTLVYVFLIIGDGSPSTFTPWLALPIEDYYHYNVFFLFPSLFAAWILSAGAIHLLSKVWSGTGNFEDTLCVLGFAISVACFASLVHDLPETFLGAIGAIDAKQHELAMNTNTIWRTILWLFYGLYAFLLIFLFPIATKVAQNLKLFPAIVIGEIGVIIYQLVFLIFNR